MKPELFDVFEVYGSTARGHGWDFLVCRTTQECDDILAQDLDALEDGEEVRVVFRKYTKEQLEDVVYD